ncbi:Tho complex subunit 7-domain-containing protein [Crucibulum laeve]|uniref:Tho complex subunit 7-domain-containing protein n=1 Tax=Crucibulum laeve TaxID=68775 RepID=A0A5C3MEK6_9AGAR|nr:Tho complex subunit 7-domain-containing protein [Crucibulum laeve]
MAVSNAQDVKTPQPLIISQDEEDQIIHARITNDERPLRRVIKRFHNYTSLTPNPIVPPFAGNISISAIDDAREAFLVELASFQLSLKKSAMICDAEARQVQEYQRERQRIDEEHETLKVQIDELKTALEHAQMLRRRKIEYDLVAEKVNTLPSRDELEQTIRVIENDMAAIRTEHETQNRTIQGQKSALDGIIAELGSLRFMGKDADTTASTGGSARATPAPEESGIITTEGSVGSGTRANTAMPTQDDEKEEGEEDKVNDQLLLDTEAAGTVLENDIEMGEVEEDNRKGKKKLREDLEEGEASDASSSELSEPPDDD